MAPEPPRRRRRIVLAATHARIAFGLLMTAAWAFWTLFRLLFLDAAPEPVQGRAGGVTQWSPALDDAVSQAWRRNEILNETFVPS
jgi:hypothetical protein